MESGTELLCTIDRLQEIITAPSGGITMLPGTAFDEVYPNIFIGEESIALDRIELRRMGITHVLNAALGKSNFHVNSNHVMYRKVHIEFLGVEAVDANYFQIHPFFEQCADFIETALKKGGKIMVNCVQGVSRSATLVIAFLMIKCHMTAEDAVRTVRAKREICPNDGFLQQLCDLNEKLKKSGHYNNKTKKTKTS